MSAPYLFTKILIDLPFVLNISTHSWGFAWMKTQFHSNVFLRLTFLVRIIIFFFLFFIIYTYNLKRNASLTHVTSFRLITPRLVGLRALGVETPLRA
jgi:hypothetical protein